MRSILMLLFLTFASFSSLVQGSALGDHFKTYQDSLESGDTDQITLAARGVYEYAGATLPETSKNRAAAGLNYGKALLASKKYSDAKDVLNTTVSNYKSTYGENALEVVDPLMELARAEVALLPDRGGRLYLSHLREALDIAQGPEGRDSFLYASLALEAGRIVFDQGESLRAKSLLDDAYRAFSGSLKQHSYYTALSGFYLGKYYLARKKYAEAEPYLLTAVQVLSTQTDRDTRLELTARAFLVEVYEALVDMAKSAEQSRAIGSMTPFNMDQEPVPLFQGHPPAYPLLALQAGRDGYAIVGFAISDTGVPEDIRVLETRGSKSFGGAALEYVEKLRFAPRFVDGVAIDTPGRKFRVNFNLAK